MPAFPRYRYGIEDGDLVALPETKGVTRSSGETYLRLAELDYEELESVLAFANEVGVVGFSGGPERQSLPDFRFCADVIADAVQAWRLLQRDAGLASDWRLPRLAGMEPGDELEAGAAEFLTLVLREGLAHAGPWIVVSANGDAEAVPDLPLFAVCTVELFNHVVARSPYRRCANETCGRLFALAGRRKDTLYCSRTCARAQAQREFRRRRSSSGT